MTPAPSLPVVPKVSWGPTSTLGVAGTIIGLVGGVVAAVKGNDVATAAAGAGAILTALTTIGGRMAQAVASVRAAATIANPWIDALQAALAATPAPVVVSGKAKSSKAVGPPALDLPVGQKPPLGFTANVVPNPGVQPVMGGTMGPSGPDTSSGQALRDAQMKIEDARSRAVKGQS